MDKGIIKKGGAWFTYGEDRFQGREQFRRQLRENKDMMNRLEKDVKIALGMIKEEEPAKKKEVEVEAKKK